jgi:hypothetical protein
MVQKYGSLFNQFATKIAFLGPTVWLAKALTAELLAHELSRFDEIIYVEYENLRVTGHSSAWLMTTLSATSISIHKHINCICSN